MKKRLLYAAAAVLTVILTLKAALPAYADLIDTPREFFALVPGLRRRLIITGIVFILIAVLIVALIIRRILEKKRNREEE